MITAVTRALMGRSGGKTVPGLTTLKTDDLMPLTPDSVPPTRPVFFDSEKYPSHVRIIEVGPRDGLQNEKTPISAEDKITLIDMLTATGLPEVEVGSFVSPKAVPQMANSDVVFNGIVKRPGVDIPVLTPNMKGYMAAKEVGAKYIAIFAAATEGFTQRNLRRSRAESLAEFAKIAAAAADDGIAVRGYVSCVTGCPYEGQVDPIDVADTAAALADMGCREISLGDTIGTGTALTTSRMIAEVSKRVPVENLAMHCHDTFGQALVNVDVGLRMGVASIDSAVAGLGGCPFAPGATGNVATEDVLHFLHGAGIHTGVDAEAVASAGEFLSKTLGRDTVSRAAAGRARRANARAAQK